MSTAIGLTPGDSSTVHIYTRTIHRTTQIQIIHKTTQIQTIHRTTQIQIIHRTTQIQRIHRTTQITTNLEECGPCPIFASFTPAFALQLTKKHGKTDLRTNSDYGGNSISKLQIQVAIYVFELSAGNCHR